MNSGRLEQLQNMLTDKPGDAFLLYAIAQEFIKLNNSSEALKFFQKLINDHPEQTGTYYHLGKLYEQLGNTPEALLTYRKGLEMTRRMGAHHDHGELMGALQLISDEDDDEF